MEPVEPPIAGYRDDDGLFVVIVDNKKGEQRKSTATENIQLTEEDDYKIKNDNLNTDDESEVMVEEYISDVTDVSSDEETLDTKKNSAFKESAPERCRMRLLPRNQQKSFVSKLRRQNPEYDEEALIRTLSRMMGNTKWRSPPNDFMIENETNFECANCGLEASHKMALARHWQEKHGPRYLICYACGAEFRWPSNLYKHERKCDAPDALIVLKARDRVKQHKTKTNSQPSKQSVDEKSKKHSIIEESKAIGRPSKLPVLEEKTPIGPPSKKPIVIEKKSIGGPSKPPILLQRKPIGGPSKPPILLQRKPIGGPSKPPILLQRKPIGGPSKPPILLQRKPVGGPSKPPIVIQKTPIGGPSKTPIVIQRKPIDWPSKPPIVIQRKPIGGPSKPKPPIVIQKTPIGGPSKTPILIQRKPIDQPSKPTIVEESMPICPPLIPHTPKSKRKGSYISELCKEQPELLQDKELLIQILSDKMATEKPPAPPEGAIKETFLIFECTSCDFKDKSQPAVARHWQSRHGPPYLECYACGREYKDSCGLYKHEKRCISPDAYMVLKARACMIARNGRNRNRKNIKLENGKLCCSMCPAVFKIRATLRSHEYTHKGLRPYKCKECPAAYTSSSALSRHGRLQHKGVMYLCDKCDRTFKSKSYLKYHLDTHLPQKRNACPECDKTYVQSSDLQIHIDRDHRNLPPPCACQICPKRYPKISLLKEHMLKKHGMNLITRTMFLRNLPHLSEEQVRSATVIKKCDLNVVRKPNNDSQDTKNTEKQDKVTKDEHEMITVEVQPIETEGLYNATQIKHDDTSVNTDLNDESIIQETHHIDNSQDYTIEDAEMDTSSEQDYVETDVIEDDTNSQDYTEVDIKYEEYLETEAVDDAEFGTSYQEEYAEIDVIKGEEMDMNSQVEYLETDAVEEEYAETDINEEAVITDEDETYEDCEPSNDLLKYVKKHQSDPTQIKPMVIIKDGQAIFMDSKSIGYYKSTGKSNKNIIKSKRVKLNNPLMRTVKIEEEVISESNRAILEYYEKFCYEPTDEQPNTSGGTKIKAMNKKRPQSRRKY